MSIMQTSAKNSQITGKTLGHCYTTMKGAYCTTNRTPRRSHKKGEHISAQIRKLILRKAERCNKFNTQQKQDVCVHVYNLATVSM